MIKLSSLFQTAVIEVVKGSCARDALPHTIDISVTKCGKNNFITIKNITNLINKLTVVTLRLTAIIGGISQKQCQ